MEKEKLVTEATIMMEDGSIQLRKLSKNIN
jgi:hypothetical protein